MSVRFCMRDVNIKKGAIQGNRIVHRWAFPRSLPWESLLNEVIDLPLRIKFGCEGLLNSHILLKLYLFRYI